MLLRGRDEAVSRAPHPAGSASLGELLDVPALSGSRIVAGWRGTGRPLYWVARFESPEDAAAAGAGDLLLSSDGSALKSGGPRFAAHLAARGVAGVAIRGAAAPTVFLAEAEAEDLPVLALPPDVGYRELTQSVAALLDASIAAHERRAERGEESFPSAEGSAEREGTAARLEMTARLLAELDECAGRELRGIFLGSSLTELRDWPDLSAAVDAYLRHRGNAIAAAEELGVHRHTVRARLRRYEVLAGISLDEPDLRLLVELAFRLARRAGTDAAAVGFASPGGSGEKGGHD